MKKKNKSFKNLLNFIIVITLIISFLIPKISNVVAVNPSQVFQINIDDGIIPDLDLSLNKAQSYILTTNEPYQINFIYGDQGSDYIALTIYYYSTDQTSDLRNKSLMYQSNVVENTQNYRLISWENETNRYALFYANQPQLGNNKYGIIGFLDGTTSIGISAKLNSDTYTDSQLENMCSKVETKAQELLSIKSMNELNGQITGFSLPIKHIKVSLTDGEFTNETTTDEYGNYTFNRSLTKGKEYTLSVTFSYIDNSTTYFSLHYGENNKNVVTYNHTFSISSTNDLIQDIALDQELPQYYSGDWAKTFASMYFHFTEVLEFYMDFMDIIKVDLNFQLPVDIYTFVSMETGTRYWYDVPGKSYITIDEEKSIHESIYRPMNREYHEFSHYIMHALYKKWPAPASDLPVSIEERNHDGYLNPSTSDSYVEGFAIFMSALILYLYQLIDETIPMTSPDIYSMSKLNADRYEYAFEWKGLEINPKAYADSGKSEERAIASVLWDVIDNDTFYNILTPEENYEIYLDRLPDIQEEYDKIKKVYEETASEEYNETGSDAILPPLEIYTLDDFKNEKYDDDNISLDIKSLWEIISHFHNDFYSIYNELISKYPEQKNGIDEMCIISKLYADTNPGNGFYDYDDIYRDENNNKKYDEGEYYVDYPVDGFYYKPGDIIGQSTNYNRTWRRSVQETPGYFIKVDNIVPFYLIKISFPHKFYLDYVVRSWNRNGFVSIPVPPEGYHALVSVIPENVDSNGPLTFTSYEFHQNYNTSINQGYYISHNFEVTGPVPSPPSMPSDTDETNKKSDTTSKTPGFELITYIFIIILIILLKRKQNH